MRAAIVTSPNKLEITEIPEPILGDYDCLCETLAVGVCGGTDNHILEGHSYFINGYPLVLGHEGIGRVIVKGEKVKNINIGDIVSRVFNKLPENSGYFLREGTFAEKSVVTDWQAMRDDGLDKRKWERYRVHRVLDRNIDPIKAVMIITWRETLSFLYRVKPQKNDRILVIGSGANALAFVEHLRNKDCDVKVVGGKNRDDQFIAGGASEYFDYKDRAYLNKGGFGDFNIVIDCLGRSENVNSILPYLLPGGKMALYGLDAFSDYHIDATKVRGDFSFYNGEKYIEADAHGEVMRMIKEGKLNADLYIDDNHVYSLDDISKALEATKRRKVLKSIIKF